MGKCLRSCVVYHPCHLGNQNHRWKSADVEGLSGLSLSPKTWWWVVCYACLCCFYLFQRQRYMPLRCCKTCCIELFELVRLQHKMQIAEKPEVHNSAIPIYWNFHREDIMFLPWNSLRAPLLPIPSLACEPHLLRPWSHLQEVVQPVRQPHPHHNQVAMTNSEETAECI